jgi:hypothetical protein
MLPPDTPRIPGAPSRYIQGPDALAPLPEAIERPALDAPSITHPPAPPGLPRLAARGRAPRRRTVRAR